MKVINYCDTGLLALYSRERLHWDIGISIVCFIMNSAKAICKLIDFDHSSLARQRSGAEHRSGTVPFMACEVLDQSTNGYVHRLHHDLESVLYMCVWHAFGYTLMKGPRDRQPLNGWRTGSWDSILMHKSGFIKDEFEADRITLKISSNVHRRKCSQLRVAFEVAFEKNNTELKKYNRNVDVDMWAAREKNARPSKDAVYAIFPAIMKVLGEEVNACIEDCCVSPTSKS